MKRLTPTSSVVIACGLIVLTNLVLLAAAGWNRRGKPQVRLSLTERELALPEALLDEGTGWELSLRMTHQTPGAFRRAARWKRYELPSVEYPWLDRAKLLELGFRVDLDPAHPDAAHHYSHAMSRRAYVVLEYDGAAWKRWISGREEQVRRLRLDAADGAMEPRTLTDAEAVLLADRTMRSRLFPVDAGTNGDVLQLRYGDRPGHVVVEGFIRPKIVQLQDGVPALRGEVTELTVSRIHVPRRLRLPLEGFHPEETWSELEARQRREAEDGWPPAVEPRYRAAVAIGNRYEPWLVEIARVVDK